MNIVSKIDKLRVERNWTFYKLAKEAGLSQQAIQQWVEGKAQPSFKALDCICEAFGMTLSELFAEHAIIEMTLENAELYRKWQCLTKDEKDSIEKIIDNFIKSKLD